MFPRRRAQQQTKSSSTSIANGAMDSTKGKGARINLCSARLKCVVLLLFMIMMLGCLLSTNKHSVVDNTPSTATQETSNDEIAKSSDNNNKKDPWKFFNGNLNLFYNNLEKDLKRDANNIDNYAIHRWMGNKHSTYEHYFLLHGAVQHYHATPLHIRMFDGGCGLGAGLMWFEREEPSWTLLGHTISDYQYDWIQNKLPPHKFQVNLESYDDLNTTVDFIYSIEALLHSPNLTRTLEVWSNHLHEGGILCVIDDFLAIGSSRQDEEVAEFVRSWQAPSLVTPTEMVLIAKQFGLQIKQARDLNAEYQINEMHYRNELEAVTVSGDRTHQAWKGSKVRGRLMVLGKMTYHMLVFQKPIHTNNNNKCTAVIKKKKDEDEGAAFTKVSPENVQSIDEELLSSAYDCNKGSEWFDRLLKQNETQLLLDKNAFGSFKDVFASRLNEFYKTLSEKASGKFVNVGSRSADKGDKLNEVAGPLEYWTLAPQGNESNMTILCDIANCPAAQDCFFDVTYSHGMLEHTKRPFDALDEIARMTKRGGLTMHVVPFSFPYHEKDDHYRFSHSALTSLLEERGFNVLDAGYDVCTKRRQDDLYDTIWLTYIVARNRLS